jgi:hypothetical protein
MPRKTRRMIVALLSLLVLAALACKAPFYVATGDPSQFLQRDAGDFYEVTIATWIWHVAGTGQRVHGLSQAGGQNDQATENGSRGVSTSRF